MLPRFAQPIRTVWQFILDPTMQLSQTIAGHGSIHMVFYMVVHVPIQKLDKRIEIDGSTAKPKVRDLVLQTDMLSRVAEIVQPPSERLREGEDQKHHPVALRYSRYRDRKMPD
jgi:hypothetical protein